MVGIEVQGISCHGVSWLVIFFSEKVSVPRLPCPPISKGRDHVPICLFFIVVTGCFF